MDEAAKGWRWHALKWIDSRPRRAFLMIVSFGAVPFGIYYYSAQLSASPAWQWPLIPDSPVAAGLYGLAVLLHHIRRPSRTLDLVAGAMMSKIGMWTVFVLLFHADVYFTPDALALRVPILATHALMLPMAFIPLATHRAPERPRTLALGAQVASALLALDAIDYTLSTHPWVPTRGIEVVAAAAVVSTITACALVFAAESMSPAEGRPAEDAKRE